MFLLLFVFHHVLFFSSVLFYLFCYFSAGRGHEFYDLAGTSYAALVPEQVLTLNTAFLFPFPAPKTEHPTAYLAGRQSTFHRGVICVSWELAGLLVAFFNFRPSTIQREVLSYAQSPACDVQGLPMWLKL